MNITPVGGGGDIPYVPRETEARPGREQEIDALMEMYDPYQRYDAASMREKIGDFLDSHPDLRIHPQFAQTEEGKALSRELFAVYADTLSDVKFASWEERLISSLKDKFGTRELTPSQMRKFLERTIQEIETDENDLALIKQQVQEASQKIKKEKMTMDEFVEVFQGMNKGDQRVVQRQRVILMDQAGQGHVVDLGKGVVFQREVVLQAIQEEIHGIEQEITTLKIGLEASEGKGEKTLVLVQEKKEELPPMTHQEAKKQIEALEKRREFLQGILKSVQREGVLAAKQKAMIHAILTKERARAEKSFRGI